MSRPLALLVTLTLTFAACGGGGDDGGAGGRDGGGATVDAAEPEVPEPDAEVPPVDAGAAPDAEVPVDGACDPVTQVGCAGGEKCAWVTVSEEPALGQTACVPDGTVALGGVCTDGAPGPSTGYDDCAAGGACSGGVCTEICSGSPDSCGGDGVCVSYFQLFDDLGADVDVGLCNPSCDPVGQDLAGWDDCAEDEGCYLQAASGKGTCAGVPADAEGLEQGDDCYGPAPGQCFLNGCAAGYQAILYDAPGGEQQVCGAFCTPADSYLGHAGSLVGTGDATCSAARIGVGGHECRSLQGIYDGDGFDASAIAADLGVCASAATWGSCAAYDPAGMVAAYNAGYATGASPAEQEEAGNAALCTFCGLSADCQGTTAPQCLSVGCLSIAAQAAFDAQYLGP